LQATGRNTAEEFSLTEEEKKELLPSGQQEVLNNRVAWRLLVERGTFTEAFMEMAWVVRN